jgi:hypothetical protein
VADFPTELIQCPSCRGNLARDSKKLVCSSCQSTHPLIGSVPWVHRLSQASLWQWRNALGAELERLSLANERIKVALRASTGATKLRLTKLAQAHVEQARYLEALLEPLEKVASAQHPGLADAMATRLPLSQTLSIYAQNIFRDWSWDNGENEASLNCVQKVMHHDPQNLLVLGSGASRLAWDLHQSKNSLKTTLALDHNPLLTLAAAKITAGRNLKLWEFPRAPRDVVNSAVLRQCSAPTKTREGLHFLLADGLAAPVRAGVFDTVLTPWFMDIVPQAPHDLIASINCLLPQGGVWINTGTCVFESPDEAKRLMPEEIREMLATLGFEMMHEDFTVVPYLQSPASSHGRIERIWSFSAKKVQDVKAPAAWVPAPAWLKDPTLTMPISSWMQHMRQQWSIWAELASMADGQRSIAEIARIFGSKYGLSDADALGSTVGFFAQLHEESTRFMP